MNWTRLLGPARIAVHTLDPASVQAVEAAAREQGATVTVEAGGRRKANGQSPHVAVVDLAAPRAIETIRAYAFDGSHVPVVAITRAAELQLRLAAFANGADDVVTVPVAQAELAARLRALLRRAYGERAAYVPLVRVGDLEIDVMENRVRCGDRQPDLTGTEQAILYILASSAGHVVSRERIRRAVWGGAAAPPSNIVDRHVRSLRSKLGDSWREPRYIATVRQHGYRLVGS